jgi:hypothetical protein
MEEQVTQIPTWAIPFLIILELIILYVVTQFGKLALLCQEAVDWGQKQQSTPSFDPSTFLKNVASVVNDIRPPIWNALIAFGINIYCITLVYSNTSLGLWVVFIAVYVNTNAIVNLVSTRSLTNGIINTIAQVELTKLEDVVDQYKKQEEEEN